MPAALPVDWNAIRIVVAGGHMTQHEAAEKFGIAYGTIAARSAREKWFASDASKVVSKQAERARVVQEHGQNVAEIVAESFEDNIRRTKIAMSKISRKVTEHVATLDEASAIAQAKNLAALGTAHKSFIPPENEGNNVLLQIGFVGANG